MALRGRKPETIDKRLKALFFGPAGVGKTTATIQFPKPYLIDTEKGAENDSYVKLLNDSGGAYFFTADFDEMMNEVTALLTESHDYQTLIIDPLTVVYHDLMDKSVKRLARQENVEEDSEKITAFGRHKAMPDRKIKHLLNLLLRLDMNVIITSHAKPNWEKSGKDVVQNGMTFDCYTKLDYLFDLVFELQKRGKERVGVVKKTRVAGFAEGDVFPFNYDEIAKRYGRETLERKAVPQVLATKEQAAELQRLVTLLKVPADITDKWLDKAQAETFSEMTADTIQKCIDHLNNQVKGAA